MGIKRYVQHISGQGEKWELFNEAQHCHESEWRVKARTHEWYHDLPKSEYKPCEPPEGKWKDVTPIITPSQVDGNWSIGGLDILGLYSGVRLRKIDLTYEAQNYRYALIIEREEP